MKYCFVISSEVKGFNGPDWQLSGLKKYCPFLLITKNAASLNAMSFDGIASSPPRQFTAISSKA
jgi:hypothetical protein